MEFADKDCLNCREGIHKKVDDMHTELKACINQKADKMSKPVIISIIGLIITICVFLGGGPLMYAMSAANDKQIQIDSLHTKSETYSVKQDMIIYNQQEVKKQIEKIQDKREVDKKELDKKLEAIMEAIRAK